MSKTQHEMTTTTNLQLKNAQNEQVTLTHQRFEQLLAHSELTLLQNKKNAKSKQDKLVKENLTENTSELAMAFLGRFGLQTADDVIKFLKSPAGETVLALVEEELAEIASIHEYLQLEEMSHELHKRYLVAFLLAALLYKRNAHAHELVDESLEIMQKKLHGEKGSHEEASSIAENSSAYETAAEEIDKAIKQTEAKLHATLAASEKLERRLAENQPHAIESKFKTIHEHIDNVHKEFAHLIHLALTPLSPTKSDLSTQIQDKIAQLTTKLAEDSNTVEQKLIAGDMHEARTIMTISNARNVQIAALHEMASVLAGESVLFDANLKPTTSFTDAALVLKAGTKVVEENGKRYLLREGQSLADLNSEDKTQAENQYNKLKPAELKAVKNLVNHNHTLEKDTAEGLVKESEKMQQTILSLANQLSTLQAAQSTNQAVLRPTPKNTPVPQMTPASSTIPQPRPSAFRNSYEHVLDLMAKNPTQRDLQLLSEIYAKTETPADLKKQLQQLKPGMPIEPVTMQRLKQVKHIEQAWLDSRKPDFTKDTEISTAPTPFQRTPRMR